MAGRFLDLLGTSYAKLQIGLGASYVERFIR